ncbi:glycerol-3-phosphate dehydrogenase [Acinetobacter kanungonis]|uniref:glycerol-3-phosphate dehydrogenase n=1 Tax=Acinetobacter kanungonis TaxID=2699469 RepID=UPI001379FF7C|nr:glycerol-3-phosphate dehydrogenase [Acinetobacter kanungonis]NCI78843.1 glycerol-3-phosphate dehydrogenase [Acinetobacter kanungonis]
MDQHRTYDLVVIGGGINGVGIAADAAGRGLSVLLCEKDDLASHTSSTSSKLIHGGLRYLEHKEFRLVREALAEREVLMAKAPHLIRAMRFIMPHRPHLRPAWLIRTGLFFYDHLGKREKLAGSNLVDFDPETSLFKPEIVKGFEYSDCAVDDARLVIANAMQAREHGASIQTRTRCLAAQVEQNAWTVQLQNAQSSFTVRAKVLVNAAGPWVTQFIQQDLQMKAAYMIRLIQGSHIIVPKIYAGDKAFILQNDDQRIVFAIPYLDEYTLIGTTDQRYLGNADQVEITEGEIDYLLKVMNSHFQQQLTHEDIISTYSGVRPLCDDESDNPSAMTRDYTLVLSQEQSAPLLSVYGGKLTTYRKLAESAMHQLKPFFHKLKPDWTAKALLPGGENFFDETRLLDELQQRIPEVPPLLAKRWIHGYGSRVWKMLNGCESIAALGQHFGHGLYQQEVDYLVAQEWAVSSDDILKRRSKLYLKFSQDQIAQLDEYLIKLHKRRAQEKAA